MALKAFAVSVAAMKSEAAFVDIRQTGESAYMTKAEGTLDAPPGFRMSHGPGLVLAPSREEAIEQALEDGRATWPESEGYFGHHAIALELTREKLETMIGEL